MSKLTNIFLTLSVLALLSIPKVELLAQKPVTNTNSNLNQPKANPPASEIKKIKKRELKVANQNSGPTLAAPKQKELAEQKNEQVSGFEPKEIQSAEVQKKKAQKINKVLTRQHPGSINVKKKKKFEKAQNKPITESEQGNSISQVDKLYQRRLKSFQSSGHVPQDVLSLKEQKKKARALSAKTSTDQRGNTLTPIDKLYQTRVKSFQNSGFEPGIVDHPLTQKEIKMRANYATSNDVSGTHTSDMARKELRKNKSLEASKFEPMSTLSREKKRQMAEDKNKKLREYGDGITMPKEKQNEMLRDRSKQFKEFSTGNTLNRTAHRNMMKDKSREASELEVGNTVNRKDYKAFLKNQAEKASSFEKGNTISRNAHRDIMKKKSELVTSFAKGNTISREAHREMMKSKSSKTAEFEQKIVLTREEKLKIIKRKNRAIDNYEAGYLNTSAERKARIQKFFFPSRFQASTPAEKLAKMRSVSSEIAKYDGKTKHRTYSSSMHPSARYLGKFSLASMADREEFRERTARKVNRDSRGNLPSYLKEKPQVPQYDKKTEKGLWNN